MEAASIVKEIPASLWETAAERLTDLILSAPSGFRLPPGLVHSILYVWQRDQLATETGLSRLLEAARIVDAEKTEAILAELGVQAHAVASLRGMRMVWKV